MSSVGRAIVFSMVERYFLLVLAISSNFIIARLLTPEQIGIYSVSMAVMSVAQVLRDFGVGNYIIQAKDLNESHIRTTLGVTLVIGLALFALVLVGSGAASDFYHEPRIVETLRISSINFLILPFCTVSLSLLRRDLQFKRLLYVTLVATCIGTGCTLSLAYLGWGANSMVWGGVLTNALMGIGAWIARGRQQVLKPSLKEWRHVLTFGGQSALTNVVTSVSMDINDLAVGKILGFAPVAIINRAQGLMNLFHRDIMGSVRGVAYPAFAQGARDNVDLDAAHTRWVGIVTVAAWPFYAFATIFSLDLLRLMFGSQWDAAAPLVPWFCLAGAIAAPCNFITSWLMAQGRIDLVTRLDLTAQPFRAIALVLAVALSHSMLAFAVTFAAVFGILAPYYFFIKQKAGSTDYGQLRKALLASARVTALCVLVPIAIRIFWSDADGSVGVVLLMLSALLTVIAWIASVVLGRHPLAADPTFAALLQRIGVPRLQATR